MQVFVIVNNVGININAGMNVKNWLTKKWLICDIRFIWNPSNCECECDKLCDLGEYLDYENCKCRKKLNDKLVEECTECAEWLYLSVEMNVNLPVQFMLS